MAQQATLGINIAAMPGVEGVIKGISSQIKTVQSQAVQSIRGAISQVNQTYSSASTGIKTDTSRKAVSEAISSLNQIAKAGSASSGELARVTLEIAQAIGAIGAEVGLSGEQLGSFDTIIEQMPAHFKDFVTQLREMGLITEEGAGTVITLEKALQGLEDVVNRAKQLAKEQTAAIQDETKAQIESVKTSTEVVDAKKTQEETTQRLIEVESGFQEIIKLATAEQIQKLQAEEKVIEIESQRISFIEEISSALSKQIGVNKNVAASVLEKARAEEQNVRTTNNLIEQLSKRLGISKTIARNALNNINAIKQEEQEIQREEVLINNAINAFSKQIGVNEDIVKSKLDIIRVAQQEREVNERLIETISRYAGVNVKAIQAAFSLGEATVNATEVENQRVANMREMTIRLSEQIGINHEVVASLLEKAQAEQQDAAATDNLIRQMAEKLDISLASARATLNNVQAIKQEQQTEANSQRVIEQTIATFAQKIGMTEESVRANLDAIRTEQQLEDENQKMIAVLAQYTGANVKTIQSLFGLNKTTESSGASFIKTAATVGIFSKIMTGVPGILAAVVSWLRQKISLLHGATAATQRYGNSQQELTKTLRTTVSHGYGTIRMLDVAMSAFQGIQLGSSILTGNIQGLGMSIFFLRSSLLPLAAVFTVMTMAVISFTKIIQTLKKALSEAGKQAQDTLLQFRALAGGITEGTQAWIASTDWSIRYGRSLEETRGAMVGFWKQGLLTENMMESAIALSSAWNMELGEAATVLSNAIGKEKQNVESLREYGITVDGVTDGMNRMEIAARVAEATMNKFGSSIDARLRTISGASQRAKSAIAGFWESFMEPIATGVIAPIINAFANTWAGLMKLVQGLWMSSQAQTYFNNTLQKARNAVAKYRPEIEMLGAIIKLIVVGAFWALQIAIRAVVSAMEKFFQWIRNIIAGTSALGRTLKPLIDMLRMVAQGFKTITFSGLLQKFKEMFNNLLTLLGPFGEFLKKMFTSLGTIWKEHADEFISTAILTLLGATLWNKILKLFGVSSDKLISPFKIAFRTFLLKLFGEAFIQSLPVEDWVKELLSNVFDFTVWGAAIGGIFGGGFGALIGGIVGTILGILDEKLGLGIGETIRSWIPTTKQDWVNLWNSAIAAWNGFWDWVNKELWPGMGEIATNFAKWLSNDIDFSTLLDSIEQSFSGVLKNFDIGTLLSNDIDGVFNGKVWTIKYGWVEVKEKESVFDKIKQWGADISQWFKTNFPEAYDSVSKFVDEIKLWGKEFQDLWDIAKPALEPILRMLKSLAKLSFNRLTFILDTLTTILKDLRDSGYFDILRAKISLFIGAIISSFELVMLVVNFFLTLFTEGLPTAIENLKKDAAGLLATLLETAESVRRNIEEWWGKIKTSFEEAGKTLSETWKSIWNGIVDWYENSWLKGAIESILGFFVNIYETIFGKSWDDDMKKGWTNFWNGILNWFNDNWFKNAFKSVTTWFSNINKETKKSLDDTKKIWKDKWDNISDWWSRTWSQNNNKDVESHGKSISNTINKFNIKEPWNNIWNNIQTWYNNTLKPDLIKDTENLGTNLSSKVNNFSIKSEWETIFNSIQNWIATTWNRNVIQSFISTMSNMLTNAISYVNSIKNSIINTLSSAVTSLYNIGSSLINSLRSGLSSAWNSTLGWLYTIKNSISNIFSSINLWGLGYSIMSGLWSGLISLWNSLRTWLYGVAAEIASIFKKTLAVKSPSRVMMNIGENIAKGLLIGMSSMIDGVRDIVDDSSNELNKFGSNGSINTLTPAMLATRRTTGGTVINIVISDNTFGANANPEIFADNLASELMTRLQLRGVTTERRF